MMNQQAQAGDTSWRIHALGGAACAGLLAVGWFFGVGPLTTEASVEHQLIDRADQAEDQARLSHVSLESISAQLADAQARIKQQPIDLSPADLINPLLGYLAEASAGEGLEVTTTKVGATESLEYFDYVPISVGGEGDYAGLLALIDLIHRERADLGLVGFLVQRQAADGRVRFELRLAWFVEEDPGAPAASTAAAPAR